MTGIWRKDGDKWRLVTPSRIPDEDALQERIVDAIVNDPQALPLSGQPRLTIVGQKVWLGNGEADVLAIEGDGRPVVIEAKLARNQEARRKVVAQALEYAADLHRMPVDGLEGILGSQLKERGYETIAEAVGAVEQDVIVDNKAFYASLSEHLARGSFRIVFLLDAAPPVLVKLAGFLEAITDRVVVDLVTISTYDVGIEQIFLPQRIDPERSPEPPPVWSGSDRQGRTPPTEGSKRFQESISSATNRDQEGLLQKLVNWADALEKEGLCRWQTSETRNETNLLSTLSDRKAGMARINNASGTAYLWVNDWVVLEKAPSTSRVLEAVTGREMGMGGFRAEKITDELLDALTQAYREAAEKE